MLFKSIPVLLLIQVSPSCFSQDSIPADVRDVTKVTFFDPGITYEKRIGKFQTLYAQAFLSTDIYIGYSSTLGNLSRIDFYPALGLQYRYYYNAEKRKAKGKRIAMNSMNYLSALAETNFYRETVSPDGEKELRALKVLRVAWGFQRNYPKRFSLDLSFGLGYIFWKETMINDLGQYSNKNAGALRYIAHIGLGFWLNKKD